MSIYIRFHLKYKSIFPNMYLSILSLVNKNFNKIVNHYLTFYSENMYIEGM